jgi:hypothetical protein
MRNVWLNELSSRRNAVAAPTLLKSLRILDQQVEGLLGETRSRTDDVPRDAEVLSLLTYWRKTVRPQLFGGG